MGNVRTWLAAVLAGVAPLAPAAGAAEPPSLRLSVHNPLDAPRDRETVEVKAALFKGILGDKILGRVRVFEEPSQSERLAQAIDLDGDGSAETIVFQADFAPKQAKRFRVELGARRAYRREDFQVYGRFVRERHDDFAWENDRVAFRFYGEALETFAGEPLTSSALDAWSKRTPRLVLNDWYLVDDYHHEHGEGGDFYPAGRSRGCGGSGLVRDGALFVSRNFRTSRVLAPGPIRLVFELDYPEWETPGLKAMETKRVTLDAGSQLNRLESSYQLPGGGAITWAAGIRKAAGVEPRVDRERGIVRTWEHQTRYGENGWLGCGVLVDPAAIVEVRAEGDNQLVIARAPEGSPARFYAGSGWDGSGQFADAAAWDRYLDAFVARVRSPLLVEAVP